MTEHSDSSAQEAPNSVHLRAPAPTPTLYRFLEAVCESHRETPGNVLVEIRIGVWSVMVPLYEVYGALEHLEIGNRGRRS